MRAPVRPGSRLVAVIAVVAAVILAASAVAAQAAQQAKPAIMEKAKDEALLHWMYIAMEDLEELKGQYAPNAVLYWLGGPLNGEYKGVDRIAGVWSKFFTANGDEYLRVKNLKVYAIGEEVYVAADVAFHMKRAATGQWVKLSLTYILVFREVNGEPKIVEEWWIIRGAGPVP